ncbi:Fe-S cluster assembly protein SufD [Acetobacter syzygii]|uniref:Fe-S cluster assembly protein SufD n=2 Tax=Acetobacter syzygii TaxID=146476 RepID=A0A270BMM8_9PROT|nr:Fe-S cluster assembly protein SufD [Acetobacter syzygii]PAL26252.1 Fe-S cluster assembly protein SufD [Acetobacter syzygii]PAL26407.1 Fe-S cluster assembly protein SufD [Acetobacter syzygii]
MNALSKDMSGPLALFANRLNTLTGAQRQSAAGALARTGLPDRKSEAWKYTALRALGKQDYLQAPAQVDEAAVRALLDGVFQAHPAMAALPRVVFVNGRHAPAFSVAPDDVDLSFFGQNAEFGLQAAPDRDPLVALNTALAEDGLVLRVPAGEDAGHLMLISLGVAQEQPVSFHPRHTVVVEKDAHLRLISVQAGQGTYFHNPVMDIRVEDGATLEHVTLQTEGAQAISLGTLYAHVGHKSVYDSFVLGLGGQLVRHEVHARLASPRGVVHVNGAQRLAGQQVGDITSVITHAASDCISRQTVRNVLDGHARGVFQGKVLVEQVAQKTDGYQMNQALLLSPDAEIDAKPELEIYADDVRCSHGATVGALDDDQLFYLRSRGIPVQEARQMLIDAFLDEAIALVVDATAQTFCRAVMAARFAQKGEA